ncbi:hypothetical protein NMY22_g20031 [Coprinellus aureogranulatus]|nr:hypothetical protein NMY22_g20031 [Coprinellus aureogranulatus]
MQGPPVGTGISLDPSLLQNLSQLSQLSAFPQFSALAAILSAGANLSALLQQPMQQQTPDPTPSRGLAESLRHVHIDSSPTKPFAQSISAAKERRGASTHDKDDEHDDEDDEHGMAVDSNDSGEPESVYGRGKAD